VRIGDENFLKLRSKRKEVSYLIISPNALSTRLLYQTAPNIALLRNLANPQARHVGVYLRADAKQT